MKKIILSVLLICLLEVSACGTPKNGTSLKPVDQSAIEQQLAGMTLEEKVGQLFVIRPDALDLTLTPEQTNNTKQYGVTELSPAMAETLHKYPVGGVALFKKNLSTPERLKEFIDALQKESSIPLLVGVDEEGGRVARLANTDGFSLPKYESMEKVGESGDPEDARKVGLTIGSYLKPYGFNVDFAPVADINTNPENIVIGDRSFGSDPELVAKMVTAEISGLHEAGMLSCIKHFPGHGDTNDDTHNGYVSVLKTWDELKKCELVPFISALSDADMIMVAHITTPNITGNTLPATMSSELLEGKLRGELGYKGVIITDAMAMGAITKTYTSAESTIEAIQAGVDIVLIPLDLVDAYEAVCAAVRDGTISEARLDESVLRILKLKAAFSK
ncbi:MAG: glycoside hydrolase family 3 protein [Clostridia bacterium]